MKFLIVLVVLILFLIVVATIISAVRETARARPQRELEQAKRLLTEIQIHDDLVPSMPAHVREEVDELLQTKHRRK